MVQTAALLAKTTVISVSRMVSAQHAKPNTMKMVPLNVLCALMVVLIVMLLMTVHPVRLITIMIVLMAYAINALIIASNAKMILDCVNPVMKISS